MTRKQRVAAAFSAAAKTYEKAATAQVTAAKLLMEHVDFPSPRAEHEGGGIGESLPHASNGGGGATFRVLEIGCGTGILTRMLLERIPGGEWLATDIAPGMVEAARARLADPRVTVRAMDGEAPDLGDARFDLIVSNLVAQWFSDQRSAFVRLAALLAPQGRLAATTLGAGSFAEWRAAHAALGLACGTPDFPDAARVHTWLGPRSRVHVDRVAVRYPDGRAFLRSLKALGAATPAGGHRPLPPGALRRVLARLGSPCSMTYEVLTLVYDAP